MIRTGLIGFGKWGKKLHNTLSKITDLQFVCGSNKNYRDFLDKVDWVIIATPNITHYSIVKYCMKAGKNVFCEKPLTLSYEKSKELYSLAEKYGVKLYVSDIQNFRSKNFNIEARNLIQRTKLSSATIRDILFNLTYHDIYKLYDSISDRPIKSIKVFDKEKRLNFEVNFDGITYEFYYDLDCKNSMHEINGVSQSGEDDILPKMFNFVFDSDSDFSYNKNISLFTAKLIDYFSSKLFPKVAVVGGGIFGGTSAWYLAKKGYHVSLFEKNSELITQASYVNQYRLHRGYHYPRSDETAQSSIKGEANFIKYYCDSIINKEVENYYCIAKEESLVSSTEYADFLVRNQLEYEEVKLDLVESNLISSIVKVKEKLFDPDSLRNSLHNYLERFGVSINLDTKVEIKNLTDFDYIINATYANLNELLPENKRVDYQFELCEKPVVKLPKEYKNKSIVIMDGPFMCLDPLGNSDYHVMGNVVHAIHTTNIGTSPVFDSNYKKLLNKGIIKNPYKTHFPKFLSSAAKFFKGINKAQHIGSMFTVRAVLPSREHDDARPTLVQKINNREFALFSGKIGTCVDAAKKLEKLFS